MHLLWHCVNNKDIRNENDSICVLVTGGVIATPKIARLVGGSHIRKQW